MQNYRPYLTPCYAYIIGLDRFDVVVFYPIITNITNAIKKTSTKTYGLTTTDAVTSTTEYIYNGKQLQQSEIRVTASTDDVLITQFKYPSDYPSTQPYTQMIANNIVTPVIEQKTYKNSISSGTFLQAKKTDYSFWNSSGQPTISLMLC